MKISSRQIIKEAGKKERKRAGGINHDHAKSILSQRGEEVTKEKIESAKKIESNLLINNEKLNWIENLNLEEEEVQTKTSEHEKYMFIVGAAVTSDSEAEAAGKINKIKEYFKVHHSLQGGSLNLNVQDLNDLEKIKNIFNKKYKEIEEWAKEVENKSKTTKSSSYISNDVVYDFKDGWKVVYIPAAGEIEEYSGIPGTSHDRILEGDKNGLCLGSGNRLYQNNASGKIYSVRDSSNSPRVTIRIDNNRLEEAKGKNNNSPDIEGAKHANSWFESLEGLDYKDSSDFNKFPPTSMEKAKALFDKSPDEAYDQGWAPHWYKKGISRLDKDVEERFKIYDPSIIKSGFGKFLFDKTLPVVHYWCDMYIKGGDSKAKGVLFGDPYNPPTHEVFKTYRRDPLMKMAVEKLSTKKPIWYFQIGLQEFTEYDEFSDFPIKTYLDYLDKETFDYNSFLNDYSDKEWAKPYLDSVRKSYAEKNPSAFLYYHSNKDWANERRDDLGGTTLVELARKFIIKNHPEFLVSNHSDEDWAKPYLDSARKSYAEKDPNSLLMYYSDEGWANEDRADLGGKSLVDIAINLYAKEYPWGFLKEYSDKKWALEKREDLGGKSLVDIAGNLYAKEYPRDFLSTFFDKDWANENREDLGGKSLVDIARKLYVEKDPGDFLRTYFHRNWANENREDLGGRSLVDIAKKLYAEKLPDSFLYNYSERDWANKAREDLGGKTLVEYAKEKMNQKETEASSKSLKSRLVKLSKTLNAIGLSEEAASVFNLR